MKPAIVADRGEQISSMEPMLIGSTSRHTGPLTDLAVELAQKSAGFRRSLPDSTVESLSELVRGMNCYYSNLIEGHNTHPIDIERALSGDLSKDQRKRDLQLEAKAHMAVQGWIDEGGLSAEAATTLEGICEIHRRFCELLPEDLLVATAMEGHLAPIRVVPGQLRQNFVKVGQLEPVSPGAIPRFLERFHHAYTDQGTAQSIIASAAMHHRLLWIHPFLDGNGRVARLMTHRILSQRLQTGSIWSASRGLARTVATYKQHLARCDQGRRNDLDGRGNLSEEALAEFTRYFLATCIDQIEFMEGLIQPDRLRTRVQLWAEEETRLGALPARSGAILEAILYRGQLRREEAQIVAGKSDRQTSRIISALIGRGVIRTNSTRAPLRLVFPATLAGRWLPGLFPEYGEG